MDPGFVEFPQTPRGRISPYLGFIPIIKCFTNVSVVWGRLIGPKTWDRIYKIFGRKNGAAVAAPRLIWCEKWVFWCWSCIGMEIGREWPCDAGSPSEPLSCDFLGIVTEGFTIPKIVF